MVIREIYEDILLEIFRSATIGIGGGRGQFLVAHYHLKLQANPKQNCPKKTELFLASMGETELPHSMCYSHLGNGVRNGAISITQWVFFSGCCKVKSIGQWRKILVMAMGFVDHLGHCHMIVFLTSHLGLLRLLRSNDVPEFWDWDV
jgi:hypothetical protein